MENPELVVLQVVVPSVLTVIGWLVAAWWALEQVKTAHEGNAKLQRQLLNESHRRAIAFELIEIYKSLTRAGNNLNQAIFSLSLNHSFEQEGFVEDITINAKNLVLPVNEAYNQMAEEIARLDIWLRISKDQIPDVSVLSEAIDDFRLVFSANGNEEDFKHNQWTGYQGILAAYQSGKPISHESLSVVSGNLIEAIHSVTDKLTGGTASINRELCGEA